MGDKSQKLNFDERLQMTYAKGSRYYEDEPVANSGLEDIDFDKVAAYCKKIGEALSGLNHLTKVRVLPYHNYAGSKYEALGIENTLPTNLPNEEEMRKARETIKKSIGFENFIVE